MESNSNPPRQPTGTNGFYPRNGGRSRQILIEKGVMSEAEFKKKLLEERAVYLKLLNPTVQ